MNRRIDTKDTSADLKLRAHLDGLPAKGFVMVAGAGSGKTTSLIKALEHVASTRGAELMARTQKIACITYTEVAAQEIAADIGADDLVHVSTIHSFLWQLIKPFQTDIAIWVQQEVRSKISLTEDKLAELAPSAGAAKRDVLAKDLARYEKQLAGLSGIIRFTYGVGRDYARGILGHADIIAMVPALLMQRPLLAKVTAVRFPYIFVDESQDTFPNVVKCLKHISEAFPGKVCLGFFGDPMQQIYPAGVGKILPQPGWLEVPKPENYRSSAKVLAVVNHVREADVQVSGIEPGARREGEVYFFVMPANDDRSQTLERVRNWLSTHGKSPNWATTDGTRILMIVHKMAARRLGFDSLYSAFHPPNAGGLGQSFDDGSAWPLAPFRNVLLPLIDDPSAVVPVLRRRSNILSDESIARLTLPVARTRARDAVSQVRDTFVTAGPGSIGRVLRLAVEGDLIEPDPRLLAYFGLDEPDGTVLSEKTREVLTAFMACDVAELRGYYQYVDRQSPYSTQHGTKGAEFARVLVVLDDDEGSYPLYSYEKYFGLQALSATDEAHLKAGRDSVIERTRRLLYVCVSRAIEGLAVVLFVAEVERAVRALAESGLPEADSPLLLADLDA